MIEFQFAHAVIPAYDCVLRTRRHPLLWLMNLSPRWRQRTRRMEKRFATLKGRLRPFDREGLI